MPVNDVNGFSPPAEQPESGLGLELIRYVFGLPDETRAKLLAFLHLAEDLDEVRGSLDLDRPGTMRLTLASTASA